MFLLQTYCDSSKLKAINDEMEELDNINVMEEHTLDANANSEMNRLENNAIANKTAHVNQETTVLDNDESVEENMTTRKDLNPIKCDYCEFTCSKGEEFIKHAKKNRLWG